MIVLYAVVFPLLGLFLLTALIYLFLLVRPTKKVKPDPKLMCDYAHRGLHGDGIPENSLAAFARACEQGYGIELDVQLSRDGVVMVVHDAKLGRMTGRDGKLCDYTADELRAMALADSKETIPTFAEVLSLVNGRVPLLVELKGETTNTALCPKVAALLQDYAGPFCIESFNPILLGEMKKYLPHVFRGMLYTNTCKAKKKYSVKNILLSAMALNVIGKPDFIAYNQHYRDSLPVKLTTKLYGAPHFVWTTRGDREREAARNLGEHAIFELYERK